MVKEVQYNPSFKTTLRIKQKNSWLSVLVLVWHLHGLKGITAETSKMGWSTYVTLLPEISCTDTGSEYTIQSGPIYHVPVKNIDLGFSSKFDGSMIRWPENRNTCCFELAAVILLYKQVTKISQANFSEWDTQQ